MFLIFIFPKDENGAQKTERGSNKKNNGTKHERRNFKSIGKKIPPEPYKNRVVKYLQ